MGPAACPLKNSAVTIKGTMRTLLFAVLSAMALHGQGLFEGDTDIGNVSHPGSVLSGAFGTYRITASGANMWSTFDEFHLVWKKIAPGDWSITSDITIITPTGNTHRKGVLMMRESLDADAAYVSAALHGDGLTSIQSRPEKGANTYEVQSNASNPKTLRLVKRGEFVYLWVGDSAADLKFSGGSMRVKWTEPFYIGIGACAHDKDAQVEVEFDHVRIDPLAETPKPLAETTKPTRFSTLETVPYPSGDRRVAYAAPGMLRGPAYAHDGASLVVSHDGRIERVRGGVAETVPLGDVPKSCESFQGFSPDGKRLAVSCGLRPSVYVSENGKAKRITHKIPTMWHGWSPDGESLLYSIERKGRHDFARIPAKGGGKELRLTSDGFSDNPEFSADGKFIYFNSDLGTGGTMQIWRMPAAGSGKTEQISKDEYNNWYPHGSPDGKRILMLSCDKAVRGVPEDREVQLRVLTLESGRFQVVARILKGGRGTLDSPSWSPDGRRIAFVTYQFLPETGKKR